jgi:hypothetical protein
MRRSGASTLSMDTLMLVAAGSRDCVQTKAAMVHQLCAWRLDVS